VGKEAARTGGQAAARRAIQPCGFVLLMHVVSLGVESCGAGSVWGLAPRSHCCVGANKLVVGVSSLRLRGGGSDRVSGQTNGVHDEDEEVSSSEDSSDTLVPATVHSSCFGRSDVFNVTIDADMLVKDLKRDLYVNFSSQVCDPEQMEMWWSGIELQGSSHDTLRSYGFGQERDRTNGTRSAIPHKLIVKQKFLFSSEFAGEATRRQQRSGMGMGGMGLGVQQAQVAAMNHARMQALLQDPAELNKLMQSPELQQIVASNPEASVCVCACTCGPRRRHVSGPTGDLYRVSSKCVCDRHLKRCVSIG